jgi:hypothetical protein
VPVTSPTSILPLERLSFDARGNRNRLGKTVLPHRPPRLLATTDKSGIIPVLERKTISGDNVSTCQEEDIARKSR